MLLLSDASALIPETDGTVVVCRHRSSHVNDIAKTLDILRFSKANVLGVVVNDYASLERGRKKYGGYRYYSRSYASYASYYQDNEVVEAAEAKPKAKQETESKPQVEQEAATAEVPVLSVDEQSETTVEKKGTKLGSWFKNAWAKIKAIPWNAPVKPVVAWSIAGGALLLSVVLMLIFWL